MMSSSDVDFLSNLTDKMELTKREIEKRESQKKSYSITEEVVKIDPFLIDNWEYRDRQPFEVGNLDELADSIENKGQAQPIIVVENKDIFQPSIDKKAKYVVIAGYRRWLACKKRNLMIAAIVREMSFEQAIACLVAENEKEEVSDYSKGMFYYKLLKNEKVTQKSLYEKLGIKKSAFINYLSFSEVPQDIWTAVGDMKKVSSRTSATIKMLCNRGEEEKKALISIADKIASGIGSKRIISLVDKLINKTLPDNKVTRVTFSENIYIDQKDDALMITVKKIKTRDVEDLKVKIAEILENHVKNTND